MSRLDELIQELCPNGVEYRPLRDVLSIKNGSDYKKYGAGSVPVYGSGGIMTYIDTAVYDKPSVLIPRKGSLDKLYYVEEAFWTVDTIFWTDIDVSLVQPKYIFYCLEMAHVEKLNKAGGVPSLTQSVLNEVEVPVPPLEVQREIVRVLDYFTLLRQELSAELSARRKQYEYYRDELLTFGDDVKKMTLGDIGKISMCKRIMKDQTNAELGIPFYKIGTFGGVANAFISEEIFEEYKSKYSYPRVGNVLISAAGTIGRAVIFDGTPSYYQDSNIVWIDNDESIVLDRYLYYFYQTNPWTVSEGGTIARLYNDNIASTKISVPSLVEQRRIVEMLDRFDAICKDISSGLPAEIEARTKQYEYYRDKLLSLPRKETAQHA